jgi:hypothetical protein
MKDEIMRKALIVGADHYEQGSHLYGCVNDAHSVKAVLERHDGGSVNFDCRLLTGTGPNETVKRKGRDEGMPKPVEENTRIFFVLQKYNRLNLLVPDGADHMWNAAMESKSCRLNALGDHYRRLVEKNRI